MVQRGHGAAFLHRCCFFQPWPCCPKIRPPSSKTTLVLHEPTEFVQGGAFCCSVHGWIWVCQAGAAVSSSSSFACGLILLAQLRCFQPGLRAARAGSPPCLTSVTKVATCLRCLQLCCESPATSCPRATSCHAARPSLSKCALPYASPCPEKSLHLGIVLAGIFCTCWEFAGQEELLGLSRERGCAQLQGFGMLKELVGCSVHAGQVF